MSSSLVEIVRAGSSTAGSTSSPGTADALAEHLRGRGADPREFWLPLHTQPPFAAPPESFPNAT